MKGFVSAGTVMRVVPPNEIVPITEVTLAYCPMIPLHDSFEDACPIILPVCICM
jgi:hypothetical protein